MTYEVQILDTSHWEGIPDYDQVPDEIHGVITKATEGERWVDDTLAPHVDGWVKKPQLFRGVFGYYREQWWVKDQVNHLVATMQDQADRVDEPLEDIVDIWAWDVENRGNPWFADWRNGQWKVKADLVVEGLDRLSDQTEKLAWLYCNNSCYEDLLNSDSRLQAYPLWVAWPVWPATVPQLPDGRMAWTAWQYTWTLQLPGMFPGDGGPVPYVDSNWINGTREQLINLTKAYRLLTEVGPYHPPSTRRVGGPSWWKYRPSRVIE